jgi:hypothetical protein
MPTCGVNQVQDARGLVELQVGGRKHRTNRNRTAECRECATLFVDEELGSKEQVDVVGVRDVATDDSGKEARIEKEALFGSGQTDSFSE